MIEDIYESSRWKLFVETKLECLCHLQLKMLSISLVSSLSSRSDASSPISAPAADPAARQQDPQGGTLRGLLWKVSAHVSTTSFILSLSQQQQHFSSKCHLSSSLLIYLPPDIQQLYYPTYSTLVFLQQLHLTSPPFSQL